MTMTVLSNNEVLRLKVADALQPVNDDYVWEIAKNSRVNTLHDGKHVLWLVKVQGNRTERVHGTWLKKLTPRLIKKASLYLLKVQPEASLIYKEQNDGEAAVIGYYANIKTRVALNKNEVEA